MYPRELGQPVHLAQICRGTGPQLILCAALGHTDLGLHGHIAHEAFADLGHAHTEIHQFATDLAPSDVFGKIHKGLATAYGRTSKQG